MAPRETRLASQPRSNSPDHNAKGTPSVVTPANRCPTSDRLYAHRFRVYFTPHQGCFSPFPHGTRSLSVTREYLGLEGGPPRFTPDYSSRALLRNSTTSDTWLSLTGLSPSTAPRSSGLRLTSSDAYVGPTTPRPQGTTVWPLPLSLATTWGISIDFSSSRYLDVSVPCVSSPCGVTGITDGWVSPFGNPGITVCVPLPRAYRSLPRPSSPSCTQASSMCILSLDYICCQAEHAL